MDNFWKLKVVEKAHRLVLKIYAVTAKLPSEEKFGLISQMRRAAVSIVANIVEATKRKTLKDKRNFYVIASGSLEELKYYLELSCELGFIAKQDKNVILALSREIGAMLNGLNKNSKY